jgi:cytochrome c peroxidase
MALLLGATATLRAGDEKTPPANPPAMEERPPGFPTPPPLGLPAPWIPADNPLEKARADLGERLFNDTILSRDRSLSCATCHPPEMAYVDGRPLPAGIGGQLQRRHAPTLLNVAYTRHPFWDGRTSSLEEQAGHPIVNPTELDLTEDETVLRLRAKDDYVRDFRAAFGVVDEPVTFQRVRMALAAFERTLLAGDSPFDHWWNGRSEAMAEDSVRGFRLFMGKARCSTCHPVRQSFALFTDDDFHATGAGKDDAFKDRGRADVTKDEADLGKFKTPTLRNVELTAPYMHDGSLATLAEVIDFYDKGGEPHPNLSEDMRPLRLTAGEKTDLVAFLKALTSPVLPGSEDGATLLQRGQFEAARGRFLRDLERDPSSREALFGVAEASLGTSVQEHLDDVAERLAAAEPDAPQGESRARVALWAGRVWSALAALAEGEEDWDRALAHRGDAVLAFERARRFAPYLDDAWLEGATAEEAMGDVDAAEELLSALVERSDAADADALAERAALRYRAALAAARTAGNRLDEKTTRRFEGAAADIVRADTLQPPTYERTLLRARSLHWLRRVDEARDAYRAAVALSDASRDALTGMAALLGTDRAAWTAALEDLHRTHPRHAQVLYFLAFNRFDLGDMDGAADAYGKLVSLTPRDALTRVFLARIAKNRGDLEGAVAHFETALLLDPANAAAVGEWEAILRARTVRGFADVERLDSGYRRLIAAIGDAELRAFVRNNLGIALWEAVSSWTSRGRGRMQYIVEGAPPEVLRWMRRCVEVYSDALTDLPADEVLLEMDFARRWAYAGILNDAGIMNHYFHEVQDLDLAEDCYLRAFRITDGAYAHAYFYNLQFLYGFERPGNDERWYRLASIAREAILKEDADAEGGFSPDERKRAAAERDYERLRDVLGEERAAAIDAE